MEAARSACCTPSATASTANDGGLPYYGQLQIDAAGNLYGTTLYGGLYEYGTVFEVAPGGGCTILHSFNDDGMSGYYPMGGLLLATDGILYGTTSQGGQYDSSNGGDGVLFSLSTSGSSFSEIYVFEDSALGGSDGATPYSSPTEDSNGNLLGTTFNGGSTVGRSTLQYGTVYEYAAGLPYPVYLGSLALNPSSVARRNRSNWNGHAQAAGQGQCDHHSELQRSQQRDRACFRNHPVRLQLVRPSPSARRLSPQTRMVDNLRHVQHRAQRQRRSFRHPASFKTGDALAHLHSRRHEQHGPTASISPPDATTVAVVSLTSSNAAVASVPSTVTINQGYSSHTFTITTKAVASTQTVTITVKYNGVTQSATLTVTPPPTGLKSVVLKPDQHQRRHKHDSQPRLLDRQRPRRRDSPH